MHVMTSLVLYIFVKLLLRFRYDVAYKKKMKPLAYQLCSSLQFSAGDSYLISSLQMSGVQGHTHSGASFSSGKAGMRAGGVTPH